MADLGGAVSSFTQTWVNLAFADFTGANLSGTRLEYADLREAILRKASLFNAHLLGADLTGAVADKYTIWSENFDPIAWGVIFDD